MKKLRLLLLALIVALPSTAIFAQEKKDTERPTWIERIFGKRESKKAEAEETKKERAQNEKDKLEKKDSDKKKEKNKQKKFSKEEREVLESWQKGNAKWKKKDKPLPPGLQKKLDRGGELPPGWKKKLEIGGKLEPEVKQQARRLPEEILKRLPEIEKGVEIIEVGGEIIKVVEDSLEIIDILSGERTGD